MSPGSYVELRKRLLRGDAFPESVWTEYYTGNALPLLGVRPLIGRVFEEADAPVGSQPQHVAVLSSQFWQRHRQAFST